MRKNLTEIVFINAAVTENVGQLGDVFFNAVKYTGEQVAQVMGKHLLRVDVRFLTQGFHLPPDIRPIDGGTRSGHKNHAAFDSLLRCIAEQFLSQRLDKKHRPSFCLAVHHRLAMPGRFNGDKNRPFIAFPSEYFLIILPEKYENKNCHRISPF